ncbi:MAG: GxxExxY protein [Prosthecobacter sp.]
MPVLSSISTRRPTQDEFKELSHELMRHVFAIHADFGRFFDEAVYKRELAARTKNVALEVSVDVVHETFSKRYFADVVVDGCGLFEFKTADTLHPKHRAQAIHYLLLFDLPHGKIVNMRTEKVQHEFVNCLQRLRDLRDPAMHANEWQETAPGASLFRDVLMSLIHDWGVGLEMSLFEEAMQHFFNKEIPQGAQVPVFGVSGHLADQTMRLVNPNVAFKLTSLTGNKEAFICHARKLVKHTPLEAILWANITHEHVTLTTIR